MHAGLSRRRTHPDGGGILPAAFPLCRQTAQPPRGAVPLRHSDQRHPAGRSLVPLAGGEPRSGRPFFGWPTGDSRPLPAGPRREGHLRPGDGGRQTLGAARRGVQHSHGGHRAFSPQRAEDRQLFPKKRVQLSAVHRMSRPAGRSTRRPALFPHAGTVRPVSQGHL